MRGILLGIMMLLCLSACAGEASPSPTPSLSPSPTATATATERPTIDYAQLTAYATYRPTLVASFTPTYTPTTTATPSHTPTASPIPEEALCAEFTVEPFAPQGRDIGIHFTIPSGMILALEIINADTGEVMDSAEIPEQEVLTLVFDPARMPAGDYLWRASLQDASRSGLCLIEGEHTIAASATPEATAEAASTTATTAATATRRPREGRATEEAGN